MRKVVAKAVPQFDEMATRLQKLEGDLGHLREVVFEMNHKVDQIGELVASINHRTQLLDEMAHLTRHLDHGFNQVRDQVEIVSALTLALQRQAERQGLVPDGPPPAG